MSGLFFRGNTTACGDGAVTMWNTWTGWAGLSSCSVGCTGQTGELRRRRERVCPELISGCTATQIEEQVFECMGMGSLVNGGLGQWAEWGDTGDCNVICGTGQVEQTRRRNCDNPVPTCGGRDCRSLGRATQSRKGACSPVSCGKSCSRYSPASVLKRTTRRGFYLLCYRGSTYILPCPRPKNIRAFFTNGYQNAIIMYHVCSSGF
ncbi:thrombospondin-2-like [Littorina saxatilis]|uniref:thrombospondin-2-like n=1 Tax=Littorina saxatilis TaxID=31220 RepID=UPI0038B603ED